MNVKISILSLVLMAGATSLFADNNDKGIDYYKAGMYSYAKKALFENIQSGKTDKAEAYYYLGEIYAAENMKAFGRLLLISMDWSGRSRVACSTRSAESSLDSCCHAQR